MKVLIIFIMIGLMGCMIDEGNQEQYQTHRINHQEKEIVIVKKYYDENGEQITDPDIIEQIESKTSTTK